MEVKFTTNIRLEGVIYVEIQEGIGSPYERFGRTAWECLLGQQIECASGDCIMDARVIEKTYDPSDGCATLVVIPIDGDLFDGMEYGDIVELKLTPKATEKLMTTDNYRDKEEV